MKMSETSPENNISTQIQPFEIVDWFSQGETCELKFGGTRVVVRFVGRKESTDCGRGDAGGSESKVIDGCCSWRGITCLDAATRLRSRFLLQ